MAIELVLPSEIYADSFIEAVIEFQGHVENNDRSSRYSNISLTELEQDFPAYIEKEKSHSRGENLPRGYVAETTYWLVGDGEFIGRATIRHTLTDHLLRVGGHIGYDIRPGKRKRGYGTQILKLALPKAKELGLGRVLVTCDEDNTGSRKIIEKNGGVFETKIEDPQTGVIKLRFWIDT